MCGGARFNAVLSPDIVGALWEKWTFLAALAGITTLAQGSIGQVVATRHGESLVRRMYAEGLAVAARSGHPVGEVAQGKALKMLTEVGSGFTASMLRDLRAGQRTEHDHVLGDLVHRAGQHGVDTPLLAAAHCHLQVVSR